MGGDRRRGVFSSKGWRAALIAASLVVVAIPPLAFRTPPLLDYPNHYARLWLLADGLSLEPTAGMYAADFSRAWTNIGVDLVAWLLGPFTSAGVLGPLFVTAAVLGPPLGALLLHRRLYGGARWWQAAIAATAWTSTLIAGFLNYQIGLGLALAAAAADGWIDRRGAAAKLALRLVIGVGLIATHIFALFFYALLMGALALGPDLRVLRRRREWRGLLPRLLMGVGPPLAALALFWLAAPTRPAGPMVFIDWSPDSGLYLLFSSIGTYDIAVDGAFMAVPALLALAALVAGKLRMHGGLLLAALSVAILSQVAPAAAGGAFWVNQRLPIMALLILIAAIDPQIGRRAPMGMVLAGVGLAAVAGRTAFVADVWRHRQADYRALERALEPVPPGATILTLEHDPTHAENLRMPPGRRFHGGVAHWNDAALAARVRSPPVHQSRPAARQGAAALGVDQRAGQSARQCPRAGWRGLRRLEGHRRIRGLLADALRLRADHQRRHAGRGRARAAAPRTDPVAG